jgi:glycosyltransferase involved in cell wall biosynthesis
MTELTTVIPVHNGERFIGETLHSVAQQVRKPDRLIVLDNCSTDSTRQVVEAFRGLNCQWQQNERNLGLFGNLNRALTFADQTQYLHLLHADDLLKPAFYERSLAALRSQPGRSLSVCPVEFIDESSESVQMPVRMAPALGRGTSNVGVRQFVAARVELRPIYFPGVLLKTAGQASPCWFRTDMPQLADHVFWANWAMHCSSVVTFPEALARYRIHAGSDTQRNIADLQAWVLDEWKAIELIAPLLGEVGFPRWLRRQKLKCLYAARSQVKINAIKHRTPEFAAETRCAVLPITGVVPWALAKCAVWIRSMRR